MVVVVWVSGVGAKALVVVARQAAASAYLEKVFMIDMS